MYFSIHWVKQVVSLLDNEEPGLGTHFSKQCSLTFCRRVSEIVEIVDQAGQTSINCLAFVMAASCRTWFMTAAFGSEEPPNPSPLLMLSILMGTTEVKEVVRG